MGALTVLAVSYVGPGVFITIRVVVDHHVEVNGIQHGGDVSIITITLNKLEAENKNITWFLYLSYHTLL